MQQEEEKSGAGSNNSNRPKQDRPIPKDTIKRLYDEYAPTDFTYGADNLNPVREMAKDKIEVIEAAIQELTDEIVRKRMAMKGPEDEEEHTRTSAGGLKSNPDGSAKRRDLARRSGVKDSNDIFPLPPELETLVGAFPGYVNELQLPPTIGCESVLKRYDINLGSDDTSKNGSLSLIGEDGEQTYVINTGAGDGSNDGDSWGMDGDSYFGDLDDLGLEFDECTKIELLWLKILLIIIRILKIIALIIRLIVQIAMIIIQIICLASGAWINPPNIAQIIQILISLIMAIISIIISLLISLLFRLINFNCLGDQTLELIRKIREALTGFSNTLGLIDPSFLKMFGSLLEGGQKDLTALIKEMMAQKKEAWEAASAEIKATFSSDNLKAIRDKMIDEAAKTSVSVSIDVNDGAFHKEAKATIDEAVKASKTAQEKWGDLQAATKSAFDTLKNGLKGTGGGTGDPTLNQIMSDASIKGLTYE